MNFDELVALAEAKGTKPGERFNNMKNSEGPSGVTSSPIGKSNYNPEIFVPKNDLPKDKGVEDVVNVVSLLSKAISLLKNDDTFQDQMRGIMNGFKKNRNQISAYQESVLKTKPKTIDNAWGTVNRLMKIVNDPQKRNDKDYNKWVEEYKHAVALKDAHEAELEKVYNEIDDVTERNDELNNEYMEQMIAVIRHTTKRLFNKLTREINEDPKYGNRPITMHDLDWAQLEKQLSKDSEAQLQLLEMLMSPDGNKNPLIRFLDLQEEHYDESKDRYFQLRRGDNYSISTDQLYRNLPLHAFVNYFANVVLKSPAIALTTKQSKMAKNAQSGDNMMERLGNVKNEREFEELRPDLITYLKSQKLPKDQKNSLIALANGPFLSRKGAANTPFKIRSSLKSSQISESFEEIMRRSLEGCSFDETDFKLDVIELFSK